MKLVNLISFLICLVFANALQGEFKLNGKNPDSNTLPFDQDTTIKLDTEVKAIEVRFDLELPNKYKPKQVALLLTDEITNVDQYIYPVIKEKGYYVSLNIKKISPFFKSLDQFSISLLIGDDKKELNQIVKIATVAVEEDVHELINYSKPTRFGIKPEIRHIFNSPPTQANIMICLLFIIIIGGLTGGLFLAWVQLDSINIDNLSKLPVGFTVQFLASILLIELSTYDYYIHTDIFTTIFRLFVIGCVSIFLGSKVLRSLYEIRTA